MVDSTTQDASLPISLGSSTELQKDAQQAQVELKTSPTLHYSPLQPDQFRLLYFFPVDKNSPSIKCRLITSDLGSAPEYSALSYVWNYEPKDATDDPEPGPQNIVLEGHDFTVTNNLYHGLKMLCCLLEEGRPFWIDQICIDQENVDERSAQVAQMRRIYSEADEVIIWLGKDYEKSGVAMRFIPEFTEALERKGWATSDTGLAAQLLNEQYRARIIALFRLLDRPWWYRVWVIQEIALAKRALVCCGSDALPYEHFTRLAQAVGSSGLRNLMGSSNVEYVNRRLMTVLFDICGLVVSRDQLRLDQLLNRRVSLSTLLGRTYSSKATDRRDKVYGILGLASGVLIQPDYRSSTLQVYSEAMLTMIHEDGSLRAFAFVENVRDQDPTWPSWVGDFTKREYELGPDKIYNASGPIRSEFVVKLQGDGKMLLMKGIIVDTILSVGEESPNAIAVHYDRTADSDISFGEVLRYWKDMLSLLNVADEHERLEAFWRTVLADRRTSITYMDEDINELLGCSAGRLPKKSTILPPSVEIEKKIVAALNVSAGQQYPKRFFTTENGRMGLAPTKSCGKDIVCVLVGGEVPYILRRVSEGHYRILGECYLHGIMDGEAIEDEKRGIYRYEDIVLV